MGIAVQITVLMAPVVLQDIQIVMVMESVNAIPVAVRYVLVLLAVILVMLIVIPMESVNVIQGVDINVLEQHVVEPMRPDLVQVMVIVAVIIVQTVPAVLQIILIVMQMVHVNVILEAHISVLEAVVA